MSDNLHASIWSNDQSTTPETHFPVLPPQSPKVHKAWSPNLSVKGKQRTTDTLAQARILAIFRSGKFPNRVDHSSIGTELSSEELVFNFDFDHINEPGDQQRSEEEEDLFDEEEQEQTLSSSSGSDSSSRSTPVQDVAPSWHPHLQVALGSRTKESCRVLVLSNEWDLDSIHDLAYQLVAFTLTGVHPIATTTCSVHVLNILQETKHEVASHFRSCLSDTALMVWHHYWKPDTSFSIYPGRSFLVTEQHMEAAYTICRLLGSFFKAKLMLRAQVKQLIDLTLKNALLLEHIDAIGNILSYATSEFWQVASIREKDDFIKDIYDALVYLCSYHHLELRPDLVDEYGNKLKEICCMVVNGSNGKRPT